MMEINKANQILRVAKMYYEEHMTQQEISDAEDISVSTVSRFLRKAEELGYIEIRVVQPFYSTADLESQLRIRFGVKNATVIPDLISNDQALIRDINKALLEDLTRIIKDGDTVGVAWGKTLNKLSKEADVLEPVIKENVKIVQLNGSASPILKNFDCTDIIRTLSKYLNADGYQICAPAFVDDEMTAEILKKDSQISTALNYAKNCDVAIFSAGSLSDEGVIFDLGCLNYENRRNLKEKGAIGDLCSHFLTRNGEIADSDLDNRCLAVTLKEFKKIPERILIVYGNEKVDIIKTILENNLVTRIYMDEKLAKEILKK